MREGHDGRASSVAFGDALDMAIIRVDWPGPARGQHESDHARAQGGNDGTDLVSQIRRLYSERKFPEALSLAKRYQQFARQRYGEDHVEFGVAITWIARIYRAQGRYSEAEPLFQHALFTFEKVIGSDHTDIGVMLNDLSGLYLALGRYGEAEPLMKRALAIAEKKEGVDHPDVAVALNNLARIYIRQGRYAEAEAALQAGDINLRRSGGRRRLRLCRNAFQPRRDIPSAGPL